MKVDIYHKVDKSDPLLGRHEVHVTDGEKKFTYSNDWNRDFDKSLGEVVGRALDDLVYHDGKDGRVKPTGAF